MRGGWRIEILFRNLKSELAIQSLRVYRWEDRLKLLGLVTLAYALLMEMMGKDKRGTICAAKAAPEHADGM